MGSRDHNNEKAVNWVKINGNKTLNGTFSDAAAFGERIFNCIHGNNSIEALTSPNAENLKGKILIDLANPYIYKDGHISLAPKYSGNTYLGEEIQKLLPNTKVVKILNYLRYDLMTNHSKLPEPITGFYCGNNKDAKKVVDEILRDFGWKDTFDMGDISMPKYTEMLGAIWVPIYGNLGTMNWGLRLIRNIKNK